jgi:hypothetical protein
MIGLITPRTYQKGLDVSGVASSALGFLALFFYIDVGNEQY